jgi:predicted MFS family arabinose efflux permease
MTAPGSRRYIAYVVVLLFLVNAANYGQRMIVSILVPAIQADIGLSDGELGALMGGVFALFYAIAGVPLARLADRGVRRTFLAGALVFWSAATASFAMAQTFVQMLAARIALGIGESVCIPTSHSLLTDYVAPENRPLAFGLHSTGGVVGATLCLILGGYLSTVIGWRYTAMLAALPGFILALVIYTTMREPARTGIGLHAGDRGHVPLAEVIRYLLSSRSYVLILAAICFSMLVEFGLNQWLPSYYVRQFGMSVTQVGLQYGLAVAIGGIPGSIMGGFIATRLLRRDVRWLVWFPAAMYSVAIPIGLCMLLAKSAQAALVLNAIYALAIFATNGAFWAACFVTIPSMMRATTSAITLLMGGITGIALGPILVGGISDALASRAGAQSLQLSLVCIESLAALVIVTLLIAGRHMRDEADRSRSVALRAATPLNSNVA